MLTSWPDPDRDDASGNMGGHWSSAWVRREVAPVSLRYWQDDEILIFLDDLLESARAAARALSRVVLEARDPGVAALLKELESLHASSCIMLWQEIEARKGRASPRTDAFYDKCFAQRTPSQRIAIAIHAQERFVRRIERALRRVVDPILHAKLKILLELHRRQMQIGRLHALAG